MKWAEVTAALFQGRSAYRRDEFGDILLLPCALFHLVNKAKQKKDLDQSWFWNEIMPEDGWEVAP